MLSTELRLFRITGSARSFAPMRPFLIVARAHTPIEQALAAWYPAEPSSSPPPPHHAPAPPPSPRPQARPSPRTRIAHRLPGRLHRGADVRERIYGRAAGRTGARRARVRARRAHGRRRQDDGGRADEDQRGWVAGTRGRRD